MGHVINPVSQRLGVTRFWNSSWAVLQNSNAFGYLNVQDALINNYIRVFLSQALQRYFKVGLLLLSVKIIRFFKTNLIYFNLKFQKLAELYFNILASKSIVREVREKNNLNWFEEKYDTAKRYNKNNRIEPLLKLRWKKNSNEFNVTTRGKPLGKRRPNILTPNLHAQLRMSNPPTRVSKNLTRIAIFRKLKLVSPRQKKHKFVVRAQLKEAAATIYGPKVDLLSHTNRITAFLNKNLSESKKKLSQISFRVWRFSLLKFLIISNLVSFFRNTLLSSLRRFKTLGPIELLFSFSALSGITASFVAKYISVRLIRRFPLRNLMRVIVSQLKVAYKAGWICGFKISCSGRFARRGRATHWWKLKENIPRSDVNAHVDYAIMLPVLTNSICAVRVWLTRTAPPAKLFIL